MMKISERLRASIPGIRGKIVRGETRYGANPEEVNRLTEIEAAVFEVGAALAELLEERLPLPGEPKHEDTTTVEHRGLSPCVTCGHAAAQHGGFGCEVLDHDDPTGTCPCRTYVYYFT